MKKHYPILDELRERAEMHVPRESYSAVCSFLLGYDCALGGEPLRGFKEWLAVTAGGGSNLGWPTLALAYILQARGDPWEALEGHQEKQVLERLFSLLDEFEHVRNEAGLSTVVGRYNKRFGPADSSTSQKSRRAPKRR